MSSQVDRYIPIWEPGIKDWLDNPHFRTVMEQNGMITSLETQYHLEKHEMNTSHAYQQFLATQERIQAERKQGSDYGILGLSDHQGTITKEVVYNAYRRQARKVHPDRHGNSPESNAAFKALVDAYQHVKKHVRSRKDTHHV